MIHKSILWPLLLYGILVISLGYYGYRESHSKISLWMGACLGGGLLLSSLLLIAGRSEGAYVGLALTVLLTATFAYRYAATHKPLPAILAIISAGMLLYLLVRLAKWRC